MKGLLRINNVFYKRVFQVIIIGIVFFFLARILYRDWDKISTYDWDVNYYLLVFSFILMVVSSIVIGLGWNLILRLLGAVVGYRRALKIYLLTELGRYIPGKIWTMVGKVYFLEKEGVAGVKAATSVVVRLAIHVVSGLLIFLVSLLFWTPAESVRRVYFLLFLLPAGLLFLHPSVFGRTLNFALKKLKRKGIKFNLKYEHIMLLIFFWCGWWVLLGISIYFLIISIYPLSFTLLPVIIGICAISWLVGFLAFPIPAGLGVIEGMMVLLLGLYLPVHIATLIALLIRVLRTVNNMLCAAIALKL